MATELEELLGFLSSSSPPIRKAAVSIVRDYTGSEDGLQSLGRYSSVAFPFLALLLAENKEVSEPAAEAFVNLSQNPSLAEKMVEIGIIKASIDSLYRKDCDITHLLIMLLVNLTQLDSGIEYLLQQGDEKMHGLYVMKLVRSFCTSSSEKRGFLLHFDFVFLCDKIIFMAFPLFQHICKFHPFLFLPGDPFEHVDSILVNISQKEAGRKLLLDAKWGLLKKLLDNLILLVHCERKGSQEPFKTAVLKLITDCRICFRSQSFFGLHSFCQLLETDIQ